MKSRTMVAEEKDADYLCTHIKQFLSECDKFNEALNSFTGKQELPRWINRHNIINSLNSPAQIKRCGHLRYS